jgi:hypothetical protein
MNERERPGQLVERGAGIDCGDETSNHRFVRRARR